MMLALRSLVVVSLVSGCGGEPCAAVIDRLIACETPEDRPLREMLRDVQIQECRERGADGTEDVAAEAACARLPSCEENRRCLAEVGDRKIARQIERDVAAADESAEKLHDALFSCDFYQPKDAKVAALCHDLHTRAAEAELREMTAIRDRGGEGRCTYVTTKAEGLAPELKARAETLCKEVEVGQRAQQAIAEARRNLEGGVLEVPFQCEAAVEELAGLGSEWAKRTLQEVVRACHVALGKRILPAQLDPEGEECDAPVARVYEAVTKYAVQDAELDPLLAQAAKACAQP